MLSVHEKTIQERVVGAWPQFEPTTPKQLLLELKAVLLEAHKAEVDGISVLGTSQNEINKWVKLDPKDNPNDPERPAVGPHIIVGGVKDFRREPESAHLVRGDGAWIHFTITVNWDGRKRLSLIAYDFEIVFPPGHSPRFIRVDLNEPGHENETRELRSHIHPGNDDLLLPAPVLAPAEILHYFLHGLRARDPEKLRR
ncbi:hypothetical protein WMF27_31820 [Sorangium sp. So ce281]|uniref:hypothetical protein n=1 Tax=unclassified Sorangium TaxID=2621164 RepID=UPI003F612B82